MEQADILERIDELLALTPGTQSAPQLSQGCASLLALVYGSNSPQLQHFNGALAAIQKSPGGHGWQSQQISHAAQGNLTNLKREIESGLTGSLRHQITDEVLTDFIQLARSALNQQGDGAKNVAAVLTAAAF